MQIERELMRGLFNRMRLKRVRSFRQWCMDEVYIPTGKYRGLKYSLKYQPVIDVWFDLIEQDQYREYNIIGPVQSGKTFNFLTLLMLYYLFELEEDVLFGVPKIELSESKWRRDILPVIKMTQYRRLLPFVGGGSRGGAAKEIVFRNGAVLKFVSGGGGDEERSGITFRVVFITEVDKFVKAHAQSKETDPVQQIMARADQFGAAARIYKECTVTTKEGAIWQGWENGTQGEVVNPCPSCNEFAAWGRAHLTGWSEQADKLDAQTYARWKCDSCGHEFGDTERHTANTRARLISRGQTIDSAGVVSGDAPRTDVCGFRFSAFHNMFRPTGEIGGYEWALETQGDVDMDTEGSRERYLLQFVWAMPYVATEKRQVKLTSSMIRKSQSMFTRGVIPPNCLGAVIGMDIGKWKCHYVMLCVLPGGYFHVADYGVARPQPDNNNDVAEALNVTLSEYWEMINEGGNMKPAMWGLDGRYEKDAIMTFCAAHEGAYPTLGFGTSSSYNHTGKYRAPKSITHTVHNIGDGYHVELDKVHYVPTFKLNADHWKSRVHREFTGVDEEGEGTRITIFKAGTKDHMDFSHQLTAEHPVIQWDARHGNYEKWERVKRDNHYLDALGIARAIAQYCLDDNLIGGNKAAEKAVKISESMK